jgi:non-ribosomal peptide synthase protein (TIGR01720 family)
VAYFDLGEGRPGRLLFVFHHLIIDGVSWRILLEDLQTAYEQLSHGKDLVLPQKTTSFQAWGNQLEEYAKSTQVIGELEYWLREGHKTTLPLPVDFPGGENLESSADAVRVEFSKEETRTLLQQAPVDNNVSINDLLLAGLAMAVQSWSGRSAIRVDIESHGRGGYFDEVDTTRTVGWFTSLYPVTLEVPFPVTPAETLRMTKERVHTIPRNGFGYGLLRYLTGLDAVKSRLTGGQAAEISFNYLGQVSLSQEQQGIFQPASENTGPVHGPDGKRANLIDVTCIVTDGCMGIEFTYSKNLHRTTSIQALAHSYQDALRQFIHADQDHQPGGHTPSDFPMARLNQQKLDRLMSKLNQTKGKTTK